MQRAAFGAADMPRTIVLDPMLRSAWDNPQGHAETVGKVVAARLRSTTPPASARCTGNGITWNHAATASMNDRSRRLSGGKLSSRVII